MDNFTDVKLEIFIPGEYVEALRAELGRMGAGRIGNYDHCALVSEVRGYWRPLEGVDPFISVAGQVSERHECKVEVNCPRPLVNAVLQAVRRIHPYEEPLINIVPLANHLFDGGK